MAFRINDLQSNTDEENMPVILVHTHKNLIWLGGAYFLFLPLETVAVVFFEAGKVGASSGCTCGFPPPYHHQPHGPWVMALMGLICLIINAIVSVCRITEFQRARMGLRDLSLVELDVVVDVQDVELLVGQLIE